MKKMIALILALVMMMSLAACGDKPDSGPTNDGDNTPGNNEQTQPDKDPAPVVSGKISLDDLMSAPENPESDFECISEGEDGLVLLKYLGSSEIVVLPETWNGRKITTIGAFVFANNSCVKAIRLSDSVAHIDKGSFGFNKSLEIVVCGNGLTVIDEAAFQECSNIHTVVLNDGLQRIEASAFGGCKSLVELEIPESVTEIRMMTFYNGPDNMKIIGAAGSFAEEFANKAGFTFEEK